MSIYVIYSKDETIISGIFDYISQTHSVTPVEYNVSNLNMNGHSDVSSTVFAFECPDNVVLDLKTISRTYKVFLRKLIGNNFIELRVIEVSETLSNLKSIKKSQINTKANELRYATIAYDGKNLDANEIAQTNISGKIAQLQNELTLALPSNDLFWKDADNIVHTWTDPAVYLEWLQGLQVQIASRTTLLYNTAWTGKAAVDALTAIDEVVNYDIDALFAIV